MEIRFGKRKEEPIETKKKYKKSPKTLDQILKESFTREISKNPALRDEMASKLISKEYGFERTDPVQLKRDKLEEKITESALRKISEDPEFEDELARNKAYEILGSKPSSRHKSDDNGQIVPYDDESPISKTLRDIREMRELEEELGGEEKGKGISGLLKDPDIIKAILGFLASMNKNNNNNIQPQQPTTFRTFVIEVNGQLQEMTESDYTQYKQKQLIQAQQAVLTPPKPEVVLPKINEITEDSDTITTLLNLEPVQFVKVMQDKVADGDEQSQYLWELLKSGASYETIKSMLEPYAENEQYKKYIDLIINRKEWVEAVIVEVNNQKPV
jgi:hypothetical protein